MDRFLVAPHREAVALSSAPRHVDEHAFGSRLCLRSRAAHRAQPRSGVGQEPTFIWPRKSILPRGTPSMRRMSYVVVAWK